MVSCEWRKTLHLLHRRVSPVAHRTRRAAQPHEAEDSALFAPRRHWPRGQRENDGGDYSRGWVTPPGGEPLLPLPPPFTGANLATLLSGGAMQRRHQQIFILLSFSRKSASFYLQQTAAPPDGRRRSSVSHSWELFCKEAMAVSKFSHCTEGSFTGARFRRN